MKKKLLVFALLASAFSFGQTYPSMNVSLLGTLDPCNVSNWYASGSNTKYSSVIGWVDPQDNKEYAIMGGTDGYYFIEVTGGTPVLRDFESGVNTDCLWREIKTYGNYAYCVSDDALPNGLIIADLSYLPDSIHVVHKGSSLIKRSHTVYVDGNKLYCGSVNTQAGGYHSMGVLDITDPENPVILRYLDQDYPAYGSVHDMWVQNDTVFASCGYDGLHIFKFNSNNTFTELASYTGYIQAGYNHSSYRTENKQTLVFCDEVPANTVVKVLEVSDLSNLTLLDTVKSNQGATPHNPYILGDSLALIAYYQDGLYIFDISDPANVTVAGYFDTHYQNGLNNGYPGSPTTYMGAWAAWPYLPSGKVLVSDMQNGLFVLDISQVTVSGVKQNVQPQLALNIFPNPSSDVLNVSLINYKGDAVIEIFDQLGKKVASQKINSGSVIHNFSVDVKNLSKGIYHLSFTVGEKKIVKEFVKN